MLKSFDYNQGVQIVREVFAEINYGQPVEVRPLDDYKILANDSFARQFCEESSKFITEVIKIDLKIEKERLLTKVD